MKRVLYFIVGGVIGISVLLAYNQAEATIARLQSAKVAFVRVHACPSTHKYVLPCPGYVIDHVKPLACGGVDRPSNMQWQTIAEGKAKDGWERKAPGCH